MRSGSGDRGSDQIGKEEVKFSEKVRNQIRDRANDRCEMCGSLALYHQIHHRRPRGMGGSKDPDTGSAANGLWVHPSCHSKIESNREQAYQKGYLVRQGMDPTSIPVKMGLHWYMLDHHGTRTRVSGPQIDQS